LACHDKWHYDDEKAIATLIGFEIRCAECHNATHIGRAKQLGMLDQALNHLAVVNKCTVDDAIRLADEAMDIWLRRKTLKWKTVVPDELVTQFPQLEIMRQKVGAAGLS
jgi:hypothetical protein